MSIKRIPTSPNIRPVINIVVSGHTNNSGRLQRSFSEKDLQQSLTAVLRFFGNEFNRLQSRGDSPYTETALELKVISSLATGTDEIMTRQALSLAKEWNADKSAPNITVHGVLPQGGRSQLSDIATEIEERHKLHIDCSWNETEQPAQDTAEAYSYRDANELMLAQADFTLLVWDGQQDTNLGGTYTLLQRALEEKVPVLLIMPNQAGHILYLHQERQYRIWVKEGHIEPGTAKELSTQLELLLFGNTQTIAFQKLHAQDCAQTHMNQPRRIIEDFFLPKANNIMGEKGSTRHSICAGLLQYLCKWGNKNIEFDIPQTAADQEMAQLYARRDDRPGVFDAPLQHFDTLANIYAIRHRNSVFWRLLCSLLAVLFLATGLSFKAELSDNIGSICMNSVWLGGGLLLVLVPGILYGIYFTLFRFKPKRLSDRYWWWFCLLCIVTCGSWCLSDAWSLYSAPSSAQWGGKPYLWCIFCQILFLGSVISIAKCSQQSNEHLRFYFYRVVAERARLSHFTWAFGAVCDRVQQKVRDDSQDEWATWYFRALLRSVGLPHGHLTTQTLKQGLLAINTQLAEDQRQYHRRRYQRYTVLAAFMFAAMVLCFCGWMAFSFSRAFLMDSQNALAYSVVSWMALILPAILSFMGASIASMELFNFAQVSKQMYAAYGRLETHIHRLLCHTTDDDSAVLHALSDVNFANVWKASHIVNSLYEEELADWKRDIAAKNIKAIT